MDLISEIFSPWAFAHLWYSFPCGFCIHTGFAKGVVHGLSVEHNTLHQAIFNDSESAFDTLKEKFTTAPVLTMADVNKSFILETDTSKWAIGATLMQKDSNRDLHPCGFLSHALTPTERNWQIYDRELYAIIYALDEWKHLLLGAEHTLTVHCDHKNLTYYKSPQRLTPHQARWWNNLS